MIERILILALLALAVGVVVFLLRLWCARRVERLEGAALGLPPDVAALVGGGRATVLAFSTPACAECRSRQAPALARLRAALGERVAVVSLQALDYPELVRRLGILTVPATAVLDGEGRVRHLNLGYASEQLLAEQLG
jgi:hypothetical protein